MRIARSIRSRKLIRLALIVLALIAGWELAGWFDLDSLTVHADTPAQIPTPQPSPSPAPHKSPATAPVVETLPRSRGGQDLVGTIMPALHFNRWLNTEGNRPLETAGKVTLYRWWTDTCPYCQTTLPAIEQLRKKYASRGLLVIVYHPKPPRSVSDQMVVAGAAERHFTGPLAVDSDWSQLRKIYLSTGKRDATSVSFLVDQTGTIRFVHPGVAYFPSDNPTDAQENADYQLIEAAIRTLLASDQK